ncbi:MAG: hypothetical protein Salg2KO_17840 [Salibacteraceae bacterium]
MQSYNRKGDQLNPDVSFDASSGMLSIKGKSIPLDEHAFLDDLITWLQHYEQEPHAKTHLEIDLKYLNGKSIRSLLAIFSALKNLQNKGKEVDVEWFVPKDADDLHDLSEQMLSTLDLPHHIRLN